jgi:DNA mismatch repair protein MutS2
MKNASGDPLEFEGLKQLVGRYVASPMGRRELERIAPGTERGAIEPVLEEVREAIEYLQAASKPQPAARGAAIRLHFDLPDADPAARRLAMEGAVLEPAEILLLTSLLDRASDVRMVLSAVAERFPRLAARGGAIGEFRHVLKELAGKILPDGSVADHASVALGRIRRDIERLKKQIEDSLERFLRTHREDGVLQEDFITIRNDRFVVPLVTGQQRRVEGVIHGASGSGHTLFLEPLETIQLNNDLVSLREEEQREVHRILREMSERLRALGPATARAIAAMGGLDLLFAKAQFALEFGCIVPRFSSPENRRLAMRDARHPLLEDVLKRQRKAVVPLTLTLESSCRTLLVSGPNTGGKTVALKTAGLLALMAQAGLPVPCAEAEFPIFDRVLADIGDNQSIQESLSTFSAHVTRVRDMALEATPDSLVLLDELGRATDPEEGGALGVAVVECFRAAGAFTLASTHLVAIKIYGANTPGVLNGSMGFDEGTLEPTYVLRLGAPGKSAGLDIAARLGMPPRIIEQARAAMSTSERDIARFLGELHQRLAEVEDLRCALAEERKSLAERERSLQKEWAQRETEKLKELERRCDLLMTKFEEQAKETIERILEGAEHRKASEQAMRRVARTRREFEDEMRATVLNTEDEARQGELKAGRPRIVEGARVRLKGVREPARVRRMLGHDLIEVEAGFLKMQVPEEDVLELLPDGEETSRLPKNVSFQQGPQWNVLAREINVIGKRAEEACEEVDKFLDGAALASVQRVRIVHGHGMGVLKKAIAELLAKSPYVTKFYQAPQSEGGAGATIAELKES